MNILPKKSWHVLTRENIERVRRDEAKAAEEEKQKQARVALAEQEARTARLREKARKRHVETVKESSRPEDELAVVPIDDQPKGHINFFKDIQDGKKIGGVNADHEAEKEAEKINYEKKIGLLTYLGQSSAESQTVKPWYLYQDHKRTLDDETDNLTSKASTVDVKRKKLLDPMEDMNRYLGRKSGSHLGQKAPDRPKPAVCQPTNNPMSKVEQTFTRTNDNAEIREKKNRKHRKYNSSDDSDSGRKHKKNKSKHKKKHTKHHKKHRHQHSSSSSDSGPSPDEELKRSTSTKSNVSIEKLRAERIRREATEKARTERLLTGATEETPPSSMSVPEKVESTRGRYNSQFHPELARKQRHRRPDFQI